MKLSFVIPCYNSNNNLELVLKDIKKEMQKKVFFDYEIILVNDYSRDNTWDLIQEFCKKDSHIIGIDLAKNFGQASALMAGFSVSSGDFVATAEDDGQSSIECIWNMYDLLDDNHDIVCAKNIENPSRKFFRSFGAKINRWMLDYVLEKPRDVSPSIFFIAKRNVIDEFLKFKNPSPYLGGLILRSTSKIANYDIRRKDRISGTSNYTMKKLVNLLLSGITAFSIKPLRLLFFIGMVIGGIGIGLMIYLLIVAIFFSGFHFEICLLSCIFIISALMLFGMGIIGEYVGRIYMCLNNQPQFVIRNMVQHKEHFDESKRINKEA